MQRRHHAAAALGAALLCGKTDTKTSNNLVDPRKQTSVYVGIWLANHQKCTNRIIPIDAETDLSPPSEIVVKSEAATADPNRTIR